MCIGMLDNGSLLFLYRADAEDFDEELGYIEDGYTLHWSSESRYWMLRQRGRAKYYFELPVELVDVWVNQYTSNLREAAIQLKENYLKNIAVYRKDGCGFPQVEVLYLSPNFIKRALKDCRHTEQ